MDQKHGSTCLPPFKETKAKFQGNFETNKVIDADHRSSSNRNINNSSILNFLSHIFLPFLLPKQEELNLSNNFREKNIFHPRVAKLKSHEYDTIYICLGLQCNRTIFIYFFFPVAPVCHHGQIKVFGVARQETARIPCELEANPPEVTFTWKFNNTMETIDIPQAQVISERTRSTASYTPMTELDYGTLLCWGTNEQGTQLEPCVYHIVPAGKCLLYRHI